VDQKVKNHEFGCGFYVSGEFLKYVKDFKIIRICCLRLKAKWFFLYFDKCPCTNKQKKWKR
jgi:hypothetical protein